MQSKVQLNQVQHFHFPHRPQAFKTDLLNKFPHLIVNLTFQQAIKNYTQRKCDQNRWSVQIKMLGQGEQNPRAGVENFLDWCPFFKMGYQRERGLKIIKSPTYFYQVVGCLAQKYNGVAFYLSQTCSRYANANFLMLKNLMEQSQSRVVAEKQKPKSQAPVKYCRQCEMLLKQPNSNKQNYFPQHRRLCFDCHFAVVQRLYWVINAVGYHQQQQIKVVSGKRTPEQFSKKFIKKLQSMGNFQDLVRAFAVISPADLIFLSRQLSVFMDCFDYRANYATMTPQARQVYTPLVYMTFPQDQKKKKDSAPYAIHFYLRHNPSYYNTSVTKYKMIYKQSCWQFAGEVGQKEVPAHELNESFSNIFNAILKPLKLSFMYAKTEDQIQYKRSGISSFFKRQDSSSQGQKQANEE